MRSRTRVLASLVFGAILGLGVALFGDETPPTHPSALFKEYCAKCHGDDGKGNTQRGKMLKAQDFTDAEWQADQNDADLIKAVTEGDDDMPAFGKKLTPEEIESLVKVDVRGFAPKK
jgi:mono/diheme cytochrome c family protein